VERTVLRRRPELTRRIGPAWLVVPGVAWLVVFFVVPMFSILSVSLQQGSLDRGYRLTWHIQTYASVVSRYSDQLVRSVVYALIVTAVCLVVSYPLAYAIAFVSGRARNVLLFLVVLPFFVSLVIRTLSWKFILADQGFLLSVFGHVRVLNTAGAVIGGLVYNYLPFMVLPLYVALERIDPHLLQVSADLYAGRFETFRRVTLPLSMPGLVAGTLLTFVPVAGDFINAELLGGPNQQMIGNVIQRQYLSVNDYPTAAALSFVLLAAILVCVVVYARIVGAEELIA
jgi:spermidine/putrescine transport system permease protein